MAKVNNAPNLNNMNGPVKKVQTFGVDSNATLEQNFARIKAQEDTLQKIRLKAAKEQVDYQNNLKRQAISEWYKYEAQMTAQNLEVTEAQKQAFINKKYKDQIKQEIELAKQSGALQTKETKKQAKQKLAADKETNRQLYKDLEAKQKELQSKGQDLSDEEKRVMEQAKKDYIAGTKASNAQNVAKNLGLDSLENAINKLGNIINQGISTYSKYQTGINARLQGARGNTVDVFSEVEKNLTKAVGITPYFKTENMLNSLQSLVEQGIAANIEQRAFLQTAKDSIATTFDVANSSLLRIIRLQQQDSTAARMGMEAYLTQFLNNLTQSTEYLNQTFDNVQSALLEASSQMGAAQSAEFEFIVQKWLGALTGTGLSESTAQNIAQAIGYIGSGDINNLNNSSVQNLMVMAASRAGLNYSELLTGGLDAYKTNKLLESMVDYLAEIAKSQNNVVRSQFAQTFGVTISDLTAVSQLVYDSNGKLQDSFHALADNMMSYQGMYEELNSQMGKLAGRTAISEMIQNVMANAQFSLAGNIASSPVLSALWQVTDMIQSVTGGIQIPFINTFFGGLDLHQSIENLMKLGIVGIGSLGMIGDVISGIGSTFAPASILSKLGIGYNSKSNAITRGKGLAARASGMSTSVSTFVGNSSSSDMYESTLNAAEDEGNAKVDAKAESEKDKNPSEIIKNYLLENLEAHMQHLEAKIDAWDERGLKVEVENYGLIGIN